MSDEKKLDDTTSMKPLAQEVPRPEEQDPTLGDVRRTTGRWAQARVAHLRELLGQHRLVAALAAVVVVILVAAIVLAVGTVDAPSEETITSDALANATAPTRDPGDFGTDAQYEVTTAKVNSRGTSKDGYEAEVEVTFSNGSVEATTTAHLDYQRGADGDWTLRSCSAASSPSFVATSGVDQDRLASASGIQTILRAAQESLDKDTGQSGQVVDLAGIYKGATAKLTAEAFDRDSQRDVVQVHLAKAASFTSYECDLTVHLSFDSSSALWKVDQVDVPDGATTAGFGPLVGTWKGTFVSQEPTRSKRLGAMQRPLTLNIQNTSEDGFAGTLSTLAHFHPAPDSDAEDSQGDASLSDTSVTGKLNQDASKDGRYVFDLSLPDDSRGTVTAQVSFGTEDDPNAVMATVKTDYSYQQTFLLIPYDSQVSYTDSYSLSKE